VVAINLFELVDHLKRAIQTLVGRLKRSKALTQSTQKHFDEISRRMTVKELIGGKARRRKLNLQITGAVRSQKREIDKRGSVVP